MKKFMILLAFLALGIFEVSNAKADDWFVNVDIGDDWGGNDWSSCESRRYAPSYGGREYRSGNSGWSYGRNGRGDFGDRGFYSRGQQWGRNGNGQSYGGRNYFSGGGRGYYGDNRVYYSRGWGGSRSRSYYSGNSYGGRGGRNYFSGGGHGGGHRRR